MTDKLALGAITISIISLLLGIWNQYYDRSYDLAKYNPRIYLEFADQNDDKFYGVVFGNVGKGAALIDGVFLVVNDENAMGAPATDQGWREILQYLGIPDTEKIKTTSFGPGSPVPAGKTVRVAGIMKDDLTPTLKKYVDRFETHLMFGVCYSSVFGEHFFDSAGNIKKEICDTLE